MPKYREERQRPQPVPGAFGLEKSKEEWEKRNRAMGPYLERRGYYADHLYIYVREEYGYAAYLWVYPGTAKELVEDWMEGRTPWRVNYSGGMAGWTRSPFRGELDAVDFTTPDWQRGLPWGERTLHLVHVETEQVFEGFHKRDDFDGEIHVHQEDDSYLRIGFYEINGIREPKLQIHVLDALAAI